MKVFEDFASESERVPGLTVDQYCAVLPLTELGNAYRLQLRYGEELRYSARSGSWIAFDGVSWQRNASHTAMTFVERMVHDLLVERELVAEQAEVDAAPHLADIAARAEAAPGIAAEVEGAEAGNAAEAEGAEPETATERKAREKREAEATKALNKERASVERVVAAQISAYDQHATRSQSARAMKAALELAEAGLIIEESEFDRTPELINTPTATVCLKDIKSYPHRPEDMLTGITAAGYNPKAARATFESFIRDICRDKKGRPDPAKEGYLKRALGYSIWAHNEKALMFFITGDDRDEKRNGRNGKSVLMNAIVAALGSTYARRFESRMVCRHNGKSPDATDRLPLVGSRIVFCSELGPNDLLDTATMKGITGEEGTAVRNLHADARDIRTTATPWILTNHLPRFSTHEQAVWSRVRRIIFENFFWDGEGPEPKGYWQPLDAGLGKKLAAEAEGILAWLVEGAYEYAHLGFPHYAPAVGSLTEAREDGDPVGDFFEACVVMEEGKTVPAKTLYDAYARYCLSNAADPMTATAFGRALNGKGVGKSKTGTVFRTGIRLNITGLAYADGKDPQETAHFLAREVLPEDVSAAPRAIRGEEMSRDELNLILTGEQGERFTLASGVVFEITQPAPVVELNMENVIPMKRFARG